MTHLRALVVSFVGLIVAAAASAQQQVLPARSEISFSFKQMGVPVEGRFRTWSAEIAFDPKKPEAGKVALTIDTASATLGVPESDAELPKPAWFGAAKFPRATFGASALRAKGTGQFEAAGKLTIKGVSRDIVVPIALVQSGGVTTATGQFALRRLDFKIGEGEWADTSMVADEVQVRFRIALSGVAPL